MPGETTQQRQVKLSSNVRWNGWVTPGETVQSFHQVSLSGNMRWYGTVTPRETVQKHQVIRISNAIKTVQFPRNGADMADERLEIVVSRSGIRPNLTS